MFALFEKDVEKQNKRKRSFIIFSIGIAFIVLTISFVKNVYTQQQFDRIEKLDSLNNQLGIRIDSLTKINNLLTAGVDTIVNKNKDISEKNLKFSNEIDSLVLEVNPLVRASKKLIAKVDKNTSYEAEQNLQTGQLLMQFKSPFKNNDFVFIILGKTVDHNSVVNIKNGSLPIRIYNDDLMQIHFKDGEMLVSMNVYDIQGNLIAEIKNNYWRPNKNFSGKFNYDKKGFEVINNQGQVALNVDFSGYNTIKVQGIFPFKYDNTILIIGNSVQITSYNITEQKLHELIDSAHIKQMFEYTQENWLHTRRKYPPDLEFNKWFNEHLKRSTDSRGILKQ